MFVRFCLLRILGSTRDLGARRAATDINILPINWIRLSRCILSNVPFI